MSSPAAVSSTFPVSELPEVLLYHVLTFVAGPTHRCHVICHQLAPLCSHTFDTLLHRSPALLDAVLEGDYGVQNIAHHRHEKTRRTSKRLKLEPLQRVRDAHKMILTNTQIAYYYLEELCQCTVTKQHLTHRRLCQILEEYGPHLRLNDTTKTGGTFLVECCRARRVRESAILQCVHELVGRRGGDANVATQESPQSTLTALCVAAARGMPTVVEYLLRKGASTQIRCTGRFRLYKDSRKSVKCSDATPLEFALSLRKMEAMHGATRDELKGLDKCIELLTRAAAL